MTVSSRFLSATEKLFGKIPESFAITGRQLLEEYRSRGFLQKTPRELLDTDIRSFIPLFEFLFRENPAGAKSPVAGFRDSSWMAETDMMFLNIRAVGADPEKQGTIIDAIKLIPGLRNNSIHLAPFTECSLGIVYAIQSLKIINEEIINQDYLNAGFDGESQLRLLVDLAHMTGKTIGFDLEPHMAQFSRIAIEKPGLFRWIRLSPDRRGFEPPLSQSEILSESVQKIYRKEIRTILEKVLEEYRLPSLEVESEKSKTRQAHYEVIRRLIDSGFWTLPSHTWKGAGLPEFDYFHEDHYPVFKYLSWELEDHQDHAFGVLTPFRFYDGIPMNRINENKKNIRINRNVLRFFTGIFPEIFRDYPFDFIRFDFVDHIYDSIIDQKTPYSDKLTPWILKKTIQRARSEERPYIGALAERMGTDLGRYRRAGFDLILGQDIMDPLTSKTVINLIRYNRKIEFEKQKSGNWSTIQYAVDTHDTDHPAFQYTPVKVYGQRGVIFKLFLARFAAYRRPKYEVIGIQDGTAGLYQANNQPISLNWQDDRVIFNAYHRIEDLYLRTVQKQDHAVTTRIIQPGGNMVIWNIQTGQQEIWLLVNAGEKKVSTKKLNPEAAFLENLEYTDMISGKTGRNFIKSYPEIESYQSLIFL